MNTGCQRLHVWRGAAAVARRRHAAAPGLWGRHRAFTLIEVLLATLIFAAILVAINAAFSAALHLRSTAAAAVEETLPLNHAVAILKADLAGMMVPNPASLTNGSAGLTTIGGGASSAMGGAGGSLVLAQPILGLASSAGNSQLRFCATTGVIATEESGGEDTRPSASPAASTPPPWPDVQMISYYLRAPLNPAHAAGKDLIRGVTRNLLASSQSDLWEQPLLTGVSSFDVAYFDGTQWQDTWDSTTESVSIPQAVKVEIQFAVTNGNHAGRLPVWIVVPLDMQADTNAAAGQTTAGSAGTSSSNSGGGR